MKIIFIGQVRDYSDFLQQVKSWFIKDNSCLIESIYLVTWDDGLSRKSAKELEDLGIQILTNERRLRDFEARGSFKFQKFLMERSLELVEPTDMILKTRTDVVVPYNVLHKINEIQKVKLGSALWTTSISSEYPGIMADHTIFGMAKLLAELYKPSCTNRNFRSGNGTKVHIDTWSNFLHSRVPELDHYEKIMGDFFKIRYGVFNWLDNRDMVTQGNKSYLWKNRYQYLMKSDNFKNYLNFLNSEIGKYVKVGIPGLSEEACFIRRLGPKYDLNVPELASGTGIGITYKTPIYLGTLPDKPMYISPHSKIEKSQLKNIRFRQIKVFTKQEINYFKSLSKATRSILSKYIRQQS